MTHLEVLLCKYHEDELFRRLTIGSPTWNEMIAEAIMKDRTGVDYRMAAHNAAAIDLVAENGNHVQVKTVGTLGSLVAIRRGHDTAILVLVIATFAEAPRFYLVPMVDFKRIARTYDYPDKKRFTWEVSASRIRRGDLNEFEIKVQPIILQRRDATATDLPTLQDRRGG